MEYINLYLNSSSSEPDKICDEKHDLLGTLLTNKFSNERSHLLTRVFHGSMEFACICMQAKIV